MRYSIQHIQQILKANRLNATPYPQTIERLLFDSRHLVFATRTLFFAFTGDRQDGHDYIAELYEQGVRNFIITKSINLENYPTANFLKVKNSVKALQRLARFHRKQFEYPIIGITGSNGKTIIKEWLYQLLQGDYSVIKNPGSYNSQIGVPLSIWLMEARHNLGIFEAGISRPKEMKKLAPIITCDIGIFTTIGTAHSEGFKHQQQKIKEKLKLFKNSKILIYCKDHREIATSVNKYLPKISTFTWSLHSKADVYIEDYYTDEEQTVITATFKKQTFQFTIPFTDAASIENAIHCAALLLHLGYAPSIISQKIKSLEPVSMRLEVKEGIYGSTLINDSYNSDITSIEYALNFVSKRDQDKPFIVVLSDVLQSGQAPTVLCQQIAQLLLAKEVDQLIAIGEDIAHIKKFLPATFSIQHYVTTQDFLKALAIQDFYNAKVLLKGARIFGFERILRQFEAKVHNTILEVNLSAIAQNLKVFSQYLQPTTQLIAMVKASAYGSGSIEVAKILEFYRVDYLAVAYADEGVELRKAGIQLPIMVLNPEEASFDAFIHYNLEPEIYSLRLLQQFLQYLSEDAQLPIHLKIDTGMHRLGFEEADITTLIELLVSDKLIVKSLFSHLAASDMEEHDAFSHQQIQQFLTISDRILTALPYKPLRHILNSSGIIRFPQYQFDMVRLGIGLYGIDGSGLVQDQLKIVNTLKANISQIKIVQDQETVGYNRSGKVTQTKRIATINIGYADGLARKAGNGRYQVGINGQLAPIIGNVCMDMCMIDISHLPDAKVGDAVIIFGERPSVKDLAACLETIPYEVFTGVSGRVKRIYYRD